MAEQFNCIKCGSVLPALEAPCVRCMLASGVDALDHRPLGPGFLDDLPMPGDSMVIADKYRVLETLGRGGMGVVYKAWQENLDRTVAVKTISAGAHASDIQKERFQREAKVVAGLSHAAIVAVYDWGDDRGVPFFSMEYVEGRDLAKVLRDGVLNPEPAAELVEELAGAVQYAHDQGVLHRDLKPSNVIIDRRGRPKITDFGLAKRLEGGESLTMSGQLLGSVEYLPPEQISAKKGAVGPWSDVYGLGTILYQALTGRPPFTGSSLPEVLEQVVKAAPVPPRRINSAVPAALEEICLKCLEKEPKRRYATAKELSYELRRFLQHEPLLDTKRRRAPALVWGGGILFATSVVGILILARWPQASEKPASSPPTAPPLTATQIVIAPPPTTQTVVISGPPKPVPTDRPDSKPVVQPQESITPETVRYPSINHRWTNSLGLVFVPIQGSKILVAIWETRVRDYREFISASAYTNNLKWGTPGFSQSRNDPVVNVNWHDAQSFCQWLTRKEQSENTLLTNQNYRLPTDVEWSLAAGLQIEHGSSPKERSGKINGIFPWGKTWPPPTQSGNFADLEYNKNKLVPSEIISQYNDKFARTSPVASFASNDSGLYDMAGNVWEWCLDSFETGDLPKNGSRGLQESAGGSRQAEATRVLRGGAWDTAASRQLLTSFRYDLGPRYRLPNVGFRCILFFKDSE
jgi:serine/threonine protein kinase